MRELCFVTGNQNKINEVQLLLKNFTLLSPSDLNHFDEIIETEPTIRGNAYLKASFINNKFGVNCFSDDSGLFIKSLDGLPGVKSARFAGESSDANQNIDLVLRKLEKHDDRTATFETSICLILNGETKYFNGMVSGKITYERIGEKGFGYDPIFLSDGYNKTFAVFSIDEKNLISHRSIAVKKLINYLNNLN